MRYVKIITDATPRGTHVYDAVSDEEIPGIKKVVWTFERTRPTSAVVLVFDDHTEIAAAGFVPDDYPTGSET